MAFVLIFYACISTCQPIPDFQFQFARFTNIAAGARRGEAESGGGGDFNPKDATREGDNLYIGEALQLGRALLLCGGGGADRTS